MLFEVEHLDSSELLARVRELTRMDNQSTARLVAHLSEFDARELYVAEGFSSCFKYCVQVLHYSEATAYRRIEAGRAARRFPVILERIADGSIHLTGVTLLAPHLTAENHRSLLESARHRTRRQIESLLATMYPDRMTAPRSSIVPLPRRPSGQSGSATAVPAGVAAVAAVGCVAASGGTSVPASLDLFESAAAASNTDSRSAGSHPGVRQPVGGGTEAAEEPANAGARGHGVVKGGAAPSGPDGVPPRGPGIPGAPPPPSRDGGMNEEPGRYRLHVTISEATRAKLERAQHLMSHINPSGDLAPILDRALAALIVVLERRKYGRLADDPVAGSSRIDSRDGRDAHPAAGQKPQLPATGNHHTVPAGQMSLVIKRKGPPRYICSSVRRAVWHRDEGRCTFVSATGHPCKATERLEFHHIVPWSHGGSSTSANLTLRCRTHNAYEAETTMGRPAPRTRTGESSGRPIGDRPEPATGGPRRKETRRLRPPRRKRRGSPDAGATPRSPLKK